MIKNELEVKSNAVLWKLICSGTAKRCFIFHFLLGKAIKPVLNSATFEVSTTKESKLNY